MEDKSGSFGMTASSTYIGRWAPSRALAKSARRCGPPNTLRRLKWRASSSARSTCWDRYRAGMAALLRGLLELACEPQRGVTGGRPRAAEHLCGDLHEAAELLVVAGQRLRGGEHELERLDLVERRLKLPLDQQQRHLEARARRQALVERGAQVPAHERLGAREQLEDAQAVDLGARLLFTRRLARPPQGRRSSPPCARATRGSRSTRVISSGCA
jgi:hypothetical protein